RALSSLICTLLRLSLLAFSTPPPPPRSTLFPYTTLFRSNRGQSSARNAAGMLASMPRVSTRSPAEVNTVAPSNVARFHVTNRIRSEEHTSELQSRENLVCRLLLEKKKKKAHRRAAAVGAV